MSDDVEELLRRWGREYGERRPAEYQEDRSPIPCLLGAMAGRRAPTGKGAAAVGRTKVTDSPIWGRDPIPCAETRTGVPRDPYIGGLNEPTRDPVADVIDAIVAALGRASPAQAVCLRAHYCKRGTRAERAAWASQAAGQRITVSVLRYHVELGRAYVAGAVQARRLG